MPRITLRAFAIMALTSVLWSVSGEGAESLRTKSMPRPLATHYPIGAWYWLNAVEPDAWERDLGLMKESGFDYVVGAFGYDSTAWMKRAEDTKRFLKAADRAGLGVYLSVWQPSGSQIEIPTGMETIDEKGTVRVTPNLYDPEWVDRFWVSYLKNMSSLMGREPNFLGYYFDDTFQMGRPKDSKAVAGRYAGYSQRDKIRFQGWLRSRYGSLDHLNKTWNVKFTSWGQIEPPTNPARKAEWNDWVAARGDWLEFWARRTREAIRENDPDRLHRMVIVDDEFLLETEVVPTSEAARAREAIGSSGAALYVDQRGLKLEKIARYFDAISVYAAFFWEDETKLAGYRERTRSILRKVKKLLGVDYPQIFIFWCSTDFKHGGKVHPTAEELADVIAAARGEGAISADMYAFRSGDWRIAPVDRPDLLPGNGEKYPIAPPYPDIYLVDRPSVLQELKAALAKKGLN